MSRRGEPDLDAQLYVIRDNLGKADAFISSAERLLVETGGGTKGGDVDGERGEDGERDEDEKEDDDDRIHDDDHDPGRRRNQVEHLVEQAKLAVRAAQYASDQMEAELGRHRAEPDRAVVTITAIAKRRGKA